jgi:hypothetical protein
LTLQLDLAFDYVRPYCSALTRQQLLEGWHFRLARQRPNSPDT